MSCSQLWNRISPELANEILSGIQRSHKKMYNTALELLAPHIKLRPVKILEMPKAQRHELWRCMLAHPQLEPLNLNLFTEWLGSTQNEMLCTWLDLLGIEHDAKGFLNTFPPAPAKEKLQESLDRLLEQYPPAHVMIYLTVFNLAVDARWQALDEILAAEGRFPIPPMPAA